MLVLSVCCSRYRICYCCLSAVVDIEYFSIVCPVVNIEDFSAVCPVVDIEDFSVVRLL